MFILFLSGGSGFTLPPVKMGGNTRVDCYLHAFSYIIGEKLDYKRRRILFVFAQIAFLKVDSYEPRSRQLSLSLSLELTILLITMT